MNRRASKTRDSSAVTLVCPFEKAILCRACGCGHAQRQATGPRTRVWCDTDKGQQDCVDTLNFIRNSATFTLGVIHAPGALPHAQARKLQCGGLIGLQNALDQVVENGRVNDIFGLVQRARKRYGSLQALPQQDIVKGVAAYKK